MFDFRSDTVTRPTPAMRAAMADADVGDDVYREDPTVRRLEERAAELLGKERALFVPSGTMANQIALLCHTRPGDEVIVGLGAHCAYYESGAGAAWSGVQFCEVGDGLFSAADVHAATKPRAYYCPRTSLCVVENTHNRAGGRVFPQAAVDGVARAARELGLGLHLDGARIWNAAVATGQAPAALAAPFDTVAACFSKGLGAPVGSVIAGDENRIEAALRYRKMLGGGMRQAGILAAGALYALDHHFARLADDHAAAASIAAALGEVAGVTVQPPETNIVNLEVATSAEGVVAACRRHGVLLNATGPHRLRLVTHLGVSQEAVPEAIQALVTAIGEALRGPSIQ